MPKEGMKCKMEGCKRPYRSKGYCNVHFHKWRRGELDETPRYKICKEEKCKKPLFKKGYCEQHYQAWSASKKAGVAGVTAAPEAAAAAVPAAAAPAAAPAKAAETPTT